MHGRVTMKPGEESGWISLATVARRALTPLPLPDGADDEAKAKHQADLDEIELAVRLYGDIAVKIRVLELLDTEDILERRKVAFELREKHAGLFDVEGRVMARRALVDADIRAVKLGVVDVQGLDIGCNDPECFAAFCASGYSWAAAMAVREYQIIDPEHRAAFFGLAQEAVSLTADDAPKVQS